MLLQWGIDEARKHGLPLYLDSTPTGHELYKRYGFKDVELLSVDLSKFGAAQTHDTWAMIRPAEVKV